MSKDGVPSSEKVYIVKIETEGGEIDQRRIVLGSARCRRRKDCKTSPTRDGSDKDTSTLKSVK